MKNRKPTVRPVSSFSHGVLENYKDVVKFRETPVMWGIPMDELLFSKFFQSFIKYSNIMPWDGFAFTESTYLPDARNQVHNAFITQSNMPYLMMLDSDILFPPKTLERLMAHNLPIVAGWYRNKQVQMEPHPIVYDFIGNATGKNRWTHRKEPGTGLEKIDGIGMGCMLMSRDAAITLGTNPYSTVDGGEDLNLCIRMMERNIPLHVDWSVNCMHLGVKWT